MNLTWLFDLDDTIISNHLNYAYAQIALAEFLFETIGYRAPDLQTIINLQAEIDVKNVKSMGFCKEGFPTSCRQTYEEICKTLHLPIQEEHSRTAYNIGMQVFDEKYWKKEMLDGAQETLEFLLQQGDQLFLLTKGDQAVQKKKVAFYRLDRYFEPSNTHIVPHKSKEVIEEVLGNREKSKSFSVGNSIRSDVEPSLAAGLKVIYIPCETWQWEREHKGLPEHPHLIKMEKISDINDNYSLLISKIE